MKKTFALFLSLLTAASVAASAYAENIQPGDAAAAYEADAPSDVGLGESPGSDDASGSSTNQAGSPVESSDSGNETNDPSGKKQYTLTVIYRDDSGNSIPGLSTEIRTYLPGDQYMVEVKPVEGYTALSQNISGIMEKDITVTVIYRKNAEKSTEPAPEPEPEPVPEPVPAPEPEPVTGQWIISNYRVYYMKGSAPVTGSTVIDGKSYQFDSSGALTETGFVDINGNTLYLEGGVVSVGYKIIDGAIYCFDGNGAMLKGTTYDGYTFDISGRIENDNVIVNVDGRSYLILNHAIYQGYYMIGSSIFLFGYDGAMVTNATVDGCVFGYDGAMLSGINASALTIGQVSDVPYNGEPCRPQVTVSFGGITLIENVHYTIEYSDNTEPGVASVTITGMGPVSGSVSTQFNILSSKAKSLTIKYRNKAGMSVAPSYETSVEEGEKYKVESPKIDGYVPDKEVVEGVMGSDNLEIVVTYLKEGETEDEKTPKVKSSEKTIPPSIKYNYKLFFSIFAVSTILVGGGIALIINWDLVKKKISTIKKKKKA